MSKDGEGRHAAQGVRRLYQHPRRLRYVEKQGTAHRDKMRVGALPVAMDGYTANAMRSAHTTWKAGPAEGTGAGSARSGSAGVGRDSAAGGPGLVLGVNTRRDTPAGGAGRSVARPLWLRINPACRPGYPGQPCLGQPPTPVIPPTSAMQPLWLILTPRPSRWLLQHPQGDLPQPEREAREARAQRPSWRTPPIQHPCRYRPGDSKGKRVATHVGRTHSSATGLRCGRCRTHDPRAGRAAGHSSAPPHPPPPQRTSRTCPSSRTRMPADRCSGDKGVKRPARAPERGTETRQARVASHARFAFGLLLQRSLRRRPARAPRPASTAHCTPSAGPASGFV